MLKRPQLNAAEKNSRVPKNLAVSALARWLRQEEENLSKIIEGAEARVVYFDPDQPRTTEFVFLNIHGFSACRQETAPIAETLAKGLQANLVELRLAGHGLNQDAMTAAAEDWLQSVTDGFDLASRLGRKTILIGTSTGAPLACWADRVLGPVYGQPFAHLMMSPNFKINTPFDFILTLPLAEYFVPLILGRTRSWTPENELAAKFWTSSYDIQAVIEMQKVVDWFRRQPKSSWKTPMAMMVMDQDPTISSKAAKQVFEKWCSPDKQHLAIKDDPNAISHVFAGAIAGPHRTESTIKSFRDFLSKLIASTH
jgi:esterase/lipase